MNADELRRLIKRASDTMRADDNTKNALKYLEHLSWLLFLKVFETVEDQRALVAEIDGRRYERVIEGKYRWSEWTKAGLTGAELTTFVTSDLLPHLRSLAGSSRADKVASLFQGVNTVMKSGYVLAEVIELVDQIDFEAAESYDTMSVLYETELGETSESGWSGEFYTPRPIVEFMVEVVSPELGQTVYDPCAGSCGFLVAAAEVLRPQANTTAEEEAIQSETFFGQEAGELAYLVGTMNLMLHGISEPRVVRLNTLEQDSRNIDPTEQHDLILTNPPFGGTEHPQVQQNFPAKSAATEILFLQHVMAKLKATGSCAIVMPDGVLSREDAAYSFVRRRLITEFNLKAIVRLPSGVFPNAPGTRTNLLFFDGGQDGATESLRYFQVHPPKGKPAFGKGDPLSAEDLAPALSWIRDRESNGSAWEVSRREIEANGFALNIIPRLQREAEAADPAERLERLVVDSDAIAETARSVEETVTALSSFETAGRIALGDLVEERGERAGETQPEVFRGVSNDGGLGRFKGKPAKDTSRYRRLEVGDFAYNPMRVNVGSLALCRSPEEEGWVSPDYVVFRLRDDAPFGNEYLHRFLKSPPGLDEINRHTEGSVRARLYFDNLREVEVPVPAEPEQWEALFRAMQALQSYMRISVGPDAVSSLDEALFGQLADGDQATEA